MQSDYGIGGLRWAESYAITESSKFIANDNHDRKPKRKVESMLHNEIICVV